MRAFDADLMQIEDNGTDFTPIGDAPEALELAKQLNLSINIHQSWLMSVPEEGGTAFYRLPNDIMEFFKKCNEKGIVGFEWDAEEPRNFGVILKKD